jgi:hypothetical protein
MIRNRCNAIKVRKKRKKRKTGVTMNCKGIKHLFITLFLVILLPIIKMSWEQEKKLGFEILHL